MSDMSNPREAYEWIRDWRRYYIDRIIGAYGGRTGAPLADWQGWSRHIDRTLAGQVQNYQLSARIGYHPGSLHMEGYRASLMMLIQEADYARAMALA